mmetsp:Transcript_30156/g.83208  ORF Transcript_30156/g.83208 Transcript_30156/m.83208 type:complete len:432 (-) Transcript_30156:169-1464(-)|eukprot:CAMPEP_0179144862 /NCGR_PEP_ID=MMETSP0796-20121207/69835_1 /TAXON_ID=73915 /ORGANISM="Pyrodinium bahamense, Strain pbaha01" /LENGTH=431 /DNA_ID=CAMNT_0020845159 /DNA_START=73 /DNA_END=1368 /DNA_ORIENTATION=+
MDLGRARAHMLLQILSISIATCLSVYSEGALIGHRYLLDEYPLAKCIDGSPGAYYFAPGLSESRGTGRFYIFLQGGGSCHDVGGCRERSRTELGSTATGADRPKLDFAKPLDALEDDLRRMGFDRNRARNPLLFDWNLVYVRYCDGGYLSGNTSSHDLEFRGAEILSSTLLDLQKRHGLGQASDVMLAGCSAGGIATFALVDWVAEHPAIPRSARFAGFPCEGYYMDDTAWREGIYSGHKYHGIGVFAFYKKQVYDLMRPDAVLSRRCVEQHPGTEYLCLIGSVVAPHIQSRLFFWQSKYDKDILSWQPNYGEYGSPAGICVGSVGDDADAVDPGCADLMGKRMTDLILKLWSEAPNVGGFLDACYTHCPPDPYDIRVEKAVPLHALHTWYAGGGAQRTWNCKLAWSSATCSCSAYSEGPSHAKAWQKITS